jgi:hypothetical protein
MVAEISRKIRKIFGKIGEQQQNNSESLRKGEVLKRVKDKNMM